MVVSTKAFQRITSRKISISKTCILLLRSLLLYLEYWYVLEFGISLYVLVFLALLTMGHLNTKDMDTHIEGRCVYADRAFPP